jgi:hypothetical protein
VLFAQSTVQEVAFLIVQVRVELLPSLIVEGFASRVTSTRELLLLVPEFVAEKALALLFDWLELVILPPVLKAEALAEPVALAVAEPVPLVCVVADASVSAEVSEVAVEPEGPLEAVAFASAEESEFAVAVAVPALPESASVSAEPAEFALVSEVEPVVPLLPEVVAAASPEASAEPVAEPVAVAPWPEAVEVELLTVEVFELLDVLVDPEPSELATELLELELELEEEDEELNPEKENPVSANTASGEAVITKTSARTRVFGSTDIRFFLIKFIVYLMYKNLMKVMKLPWRALRIKHICGQKCKSCPFDL